MNHATQSQVGQNASIKKRNFEEAIQRMGLSTDGTDK